MTDNNTTADKEKEGFWICFTPAGTMIWETEAKTEQECWEKVLKEGSHMPYDGIEGFKERGYSVEFLEEKEDE